MLIEEIDQGRVDAQSPGGGPSRLRSPHVPIVRSPAHPMSPNKGVHVSQSDHQVSDGFISISMKMF
jgi:hypothetical protein